MVFHNFFFIYVFEVKESIVENPAELRCKGDLENFFNRKLFWIFEVLQTS